jgi:hypothetical protein
MAKLVLPRFDKTIFVALDIGMYTSCFRSRSLLGQLTLNAIHKL